MRTDDVLFETGNPNISDESLALVARSFTPHLYAQSTLIGASVELTIIAIWRYGEDVVVRAKPPGLVDEVEMRVPWVKVIDNQPYLLLTYSPELTADDAVIPIIVVAYKSERILKTVNAVTVMKLAPHMAKLVASQRRSALSDIEKLLGAISKRQ